MASIVSIHSFRGGTGKSNLTANVAALLAQKGQRVGVVDTDINSPGIHVIFNLEDQLSYALNDYLWGKCSIDEAAYDVGGDLGLGEKMLYLIPSSIQTGEIIKILKEGYDVQMLYDGFQDLVDALELDILMIDTHPGLNEETLTSIAFSDILVILLRPDNQDYQGTAVTVDVARGLDVPHLFLVVNKCPAALKPDAVRVKVEETYDSEVVSVLPLSEDVVVLASSGIFCLQYPDHAVTRGLEAVAQRILDLKE